MNSRRSCIISIKSGANPGQGGFSLLEIVVSMAIFILLILAATQIFGTILQQQRSIYVKNNEEATFRYALEVMNKDMRSAQRELTTSTTWCLDSSYAFKIFQTPVASNDSALAFLDKDQNCTVYYLSNGALMVNKRKRTVATSTIKSLTPSNIIVKQFALYLPPQNIYEPGAVTYKLVFGAATGTSGYKEDYTIQSTVSARYYD